jgi:GMP synthase-like glutamine amidotransferase
MRIKRFESHKFVMEDIKNIFPNILKIYSSTGNYELELGDFTREGNIIRADYYHNTYEETGDALQDGEPNLLVFDLHFVNNKNGLKVITDITYGDSMKYSFSVEAPNQVTISHYNGIDSLLDSDTQFGFEDESIDSLVELFNNFSESYQLTKEDFTFLDKYPDTFNPEELEEVPDTKIKYFSKEKNLVLPTNSEKPGEAALSHGKKILVINNSLAPKNRYLLNILKYLQLRGLNNVVVSNEKELEDVLKKYKISCVISSGSDKRVKDDDSRRMTEIALDSLKCPFLGICFGFQTLAKYCGSEIGSEEFTHKNKKIERTKHFLFNGLKYDNQFSFSFNDFPVNCPNGFEVICKVDGKIAGIGDDINKRYGILFHPEDIEHTYKVLDNFIELTDKQKVEQDKLKLGKFESVMRFKDFKRMN